MPCFPAIFRALQKKTCFPKRSENATSFSTCSQKCDVFQQFFAFPGKSCLPKRSENFKVSPKMPCFPAIFRALQKKRVFQNALKTKRFLQHEHKSAMFSSNFSRFQENRAFQNALKISKSAQKCLVFQRFFALSKKKRVFQNALKTQRLFQHVLKNAMFSSNFSHFQQNRAFQNALKISKSAQKCLVFQRFFALSKKNVFSKTLWKRNVFFNTNTKVLCFPAIFRVSRKIVPSKTLWKFQSQPKNALFSSDFSRSPKKNVFSKTLWKRNVFFNMFSKMRCFPAIFRKKFFQQFFAFPAKSCLPKRSENFKVSPKMPCFPAIFRALQKKFFATSFSTCSQKCDVFQQFFAFPAKFSKTLWKFQNSPKMPCFPTLFPKRSENETFRFEHFWKMKRDVFPNFSSNTTFSLEKAENFLENLAFQKKRTPKENLWLNRFWSFRGMWSLSETRVFLENIAFSNFLTNTTLLKRQNIPWKIRHFATRFKARDLCLKRTISWKIKHF